MDRRQRATAVLVAGAFFMEMLDATILATAAPSIARSFGVDSSVIGIAITAYLVTVAALIPVSGWLSERWGTRRIFLLAIAVFTLASAICAATTSVSTLTAARVVQGAGAALMVPVGRLAVLRGIDKTDLIRTIAYLTWPALLAPVLAPVIGGALATYAGWQWIFLVNLPLGVIGFAVAARLLTAPPQPRPGPLDWVGLLLTAIALSSLVMAAESAAARGGPGWLTALWAGTAALAGFLAVRHLGRAAHPLLALGVLRTRTFRLTQTSGLLYRMAIVAVPFLLALMFQDAFGWSAVRAGSFVLFLFAGNIAIKPATTPLLMAFGFKPVLIVAISIGIACIVGLSSMSSETAPFVIAAVLFVSGAARSTGFTAYNSLTFADIDAGDMPAANTLSSTLQQLAEGLGVAIAALAVQLATPAGVPTDSTFPYRVALWTVATLALIPLVDAIALRRDAGGGLRTR